MNEAIENPGATVTTVHTTLEGHVVIQQPQGSVTLVSAAQILAIIKELHVCYDYCAAWKEPAENT